MRAYSGESGRTLFSTGILQPSFWTDSPRLALVKVLAVGKSLIINFLLIDYDSEIRWTKFVISKFDNFKFL